MRHVLAAIFRACRDDEEGIKKTGNVHSEVILSLSTTSNIGDAYRRFGIKAESKAVVVVHVLTESDMVKRMVIGSMLNIAHG